MAHSTSGRWAGRPVGRRTAPPDGAVIVDELTPEIASLLRNASVRPPPVWFLAAAGGAPDPRWHPLPVAGDGSVGVYVPVNPMAERHRHHGFGFTGYHLVLSGRAAAEDEPPAEVAWLSAAFPDEHVVLVEQAAASAWRARALRGRVSVDTRMDLWRLLAHAAVCVDLGPGGLVARECIEALRLGTPVVAPVRRRPRRRSGRRGRRRHLRRCGRARRRGRCAARRSDAPGRVRARATPRRCAARRSGSERRTAGSTAGRGVSRRRAPSTSSCRARGRSTGRLTCVRTCRDLPRRPATMRRPKDQAAVTFFFAMTDISLRLRWTAP